MQQSILISAVLFIAPAEAATLYVDPSAPSGGNGLTWQTSFNVLQSALDVAALPQNNITEIRLAKGSYKPTARTDAQDPRSATFQMRSGLAIRGGFAGWDAHDPNARDVSKFVSVLSGDLNSDDGPVGSWTNYSENAYHILTALSVDDSSILDGITITGGSACCGLEQFDPRSFAGGVHSIGSSPTLVACTISYCQGNRGGGVYSENGSPVLTDCTFIGNKGEGINREGAAIYFREGDLTLTNCTFTQNIAGRGGAIYHRDGSATLQSCLFQQNQATADYGGAMFALNSVLEIAECNFMVNTGQWIGCMLASGSAVTLSSCVFDGNVSNNLGGGAIEVSDGTLEAIDCSLINNRSLEGNGGALNLSGVSAQIAHCSFTGNQAFSEGGAIRITALQTSNLKATIRDSYFENNIAGLFDGGAINVSFQETLIASCVFRNNRCGGDGGAIYSLGNGHLRTVVNSLFYENRSTGFGGGAGAIHVSSGPMAIINSTIVDNHSSGGTGSAAIENTSFQTTTIHNSILWNNSPAQISNSPISLYSSNIQGGWSGPGANNINVPPQFVNSAADDYRIDAGSPCIDAADTAVIPLSEPVDLGGEPRLIDDPATKDTGFGPPPLSDMGCYEFQPPAGKCQGDVNNDNVVSVPDLLIVIQSWGFPGGPADVDGNGTVNVNDLLFIIVAWGPCS